MKNSIKVYKHQENLDMLSCIFYFKNRQFFIDIKNNKKNNLIYFPGKIKEKHFLIKQKDIISIYYKNKIFFNKDIKLDIYLRLSKYKFFKKKILTHKTNKIRKKHTHKKYSTYLNVKHYNITM